MIPTLSLTWELLEPYDSSLSTWDQAWVLLEDHDNHVPLRGEALEMCDLLLAGQITRLALDMKKWKKDCLVVPSMKRARPKEFILFCKKTFTWERAIDLATQLHRKFIVVLEESDGSDDGQKKAFLALPKGVPQNLPFSLTRVVTPARNSVAGV